MNHTIPNSILICPNCTSGPLASKNGNPDLICPKCSASFPVTAGGRPILLRNDNEVFSIEDYTQLDKSHFQAQGNSWLRRVIPSASVNLSRNEILAQ